MFEAWCGGLRVCLCVRQTLINPILLSPFHSLISLTHSRPASFVSNEIHKRSKSFFLRHISLHHHHRDADNQLQKMPKRAIIIFCLGPFLMMMILRCFLLCILGNNSSRTAQDKLHTQLTLTTAVWCTVADDNEKFINFFCAFQLFCPRALHKNRCFVWGERAGQQWSRRQQQWCWSILLTSSSDAAVQSTHKKWFAASADAQCCSLMMETLFATATIRNYFVLGIQSLGSVEVVLSCFTEKGAPTIVSPHLRTQPKAWNFPPFAILACLFEGWNEWEREKGKCWSVEFSPSFSS